MKKFVLALLVGAMVTGFASLAAADVTVGGYAEVRYDLWNDITLNREASSFHSINFFDERILVNIDAKVNEGLEGFVEFDTDNFNWGQATSITNLPAYLNHDDAVGKIGLRQAWIDAMVPGIPVGVKIGHQPLNLGHGIWLDTSRYGSDAIYAYSKPVPGLLVGGIYAQLTQNLPTTPPDSGALNRITIPLDTTPVLNQPQDNSFRKNSAKMCALLAKYTWFENNTIGVNATYLSDNNTFSGTEFNEGLGLDHRLWATNTAFVLDGSIAGLTYKGEFDWLYADMEDVFGDEAYIVNGFAAMFGADVKVLNVANVGAELAYGSGNSAYRPEIFYNPGGADNIPFSNTKHQDHAYYTPYDTTSYNYAFLYNDKIGQGPLGSGGGFGFGDGYGGFGLANTGYIKVSAGVTPTDKLKADVDVLYLRASESMLPGQSRDLGWEIDANLDYKLYDNLSLDLTGGVFIPGAWYAFQGHDPVTENRGILTNPNNPDSALKRDVAWGLESKLSMKF